MFLKDIIVQNLFFPGVLTWEESSIFNSLLYFIMFRIIFIFIFLTLLSWCSGQSSMWNTNNNSWGSATGLAVDISKWLDSDSGSLWWIIHTPIPATWSMEVYSDSLVFHVFKQNSKCTPWGMVEWSLYCEWVTWYNHLYKIPPLKLEYLYDSWIFNYKDQSYQRMLTAAWWTSPVVLSWNMMYQVGQNENYPIEDPVILLKKKISDSPQDVIDDLVSKWCDISLVTGNNFAWYTQYFVPVLKDSNIDNYTWSSNVCIPEFPVNLQSSYRWFMFSPESKDYYYVIWDPWAWSAPARYDSKSLKLFVE